MAGDRTHTWPGDAPAEGDTAGDEDFPIQQLLAGAGAVAWELDLSSRLMTYVSPGIEQIIGHAPERWLGEPELLRSLLRDEDWTALVSSAEGSPGWRRSVEMELRTPHRSSRWVRAELRGLGPERDRTARVRGLMVDVTREHAAARHLADQVRRVALTDAVGATLSAGGSLQSMLQRSAESIVEHIGAAFARIWTLNAAEGTLELVASAGLYTHLDGPHGRVPVGMYKIGKIAKERAPHLTNDVQNDPRVSDKEWARREGMVAFAGYPLLVEKRLVGVVALFSREPLSEAALDALSGVAERLALVVEQKRAQEKLQEREAQLAEAQRIAGIGSWEWEVGTNEVVWSDELYRLYGLEPQSVHGTFESYLERVHPDDRDRVRMVIEEVVRTAGSFDFDERIVRPDGEVRVLQSRGRTLTSSDGRVVRLVGTCQDVTEARRAAERERTLAQEQARRMIAEEQEERASLLAEVSELLSSSLEFETTLRSLAHTVVPRLADWCAIDVVGDDGGPHRMVTAHPDPAKEELARQLERRYPPDPDAPHGVHEVVRTGQPVLVPRIPRELLEQSARDEEHLRILRELHLHSYLVVPLTARGRILGALTLVCAESGGEYDESDLAFAQELARRAAFAVDNARLYREAERARSQTERILTSITDAFFSLDREWRFAYVNDQAEQLLARSREELLGRNLWEEFPEALGTTFQEMYEAASRENRTVQFEEFYPPLSAWFEVRAYPSPDGISVYFHDITGAKRAQQELEYQAYIRRTITENATQALFMMDETGRCTYMNPAAEEMTGYRWEEIRHVPLHDAIHHLHPDGTPYPLQDCPIDRALPEDCSIRAHEDVFLRKDGTFFPVVCAVSPFFDAEGRPVGTVVEVRDVTEERRAQEEIRERERQFRFLADSIPQQVWVTRADGYHEYYNQRWYDYTGLSEEESVGTGWTELLHPDDVEHTARLWQNSVRTGEPYSIEYRFRRHDGEYRWFLGQALPLRDEQGSIVRWFGTLTDIQDHKEAEAERERLIAEIDLERHRLHKIFEEAPAFIATLDGPNHLFGSANPHYLKLVGHREVVGKTVAEALPEVVEQGFIDLLDQVYRSGEPFIGSEIPVLLQSRRDADPEERIVNFVYQPMLGVTGRPTGIFVHGVDVTDQVVARRVIEEKAEELAQLTRALELSNRELDQFAYVASHDLKAPLRGIANLSQWLEEDLEGELNPEAREHLELMRGRVNRMEGLIDGILEYSRAGRVREKPERVEVSALLTDVLDLLGVPEEVRVELPDELPTLFTERLPLQQVFLNLIGNAVKYAGRDDPMVGVEVSDRGLFLEFVVSDNGPGIAPEYHDRIFGIFQTLEARDKVEGTGIGLSLVKKIVEARGGRVWIESEEGDGAAFHFLWPQQQPVEN
jgi:PAS domain S-box-containing protein